MHSSRSDCRKVRADMLASQLGEKTNLAAPTIEGHLRECQACRRYRDGLALAELVPTPGRLYSAELRWRALAAVRRREDVRHPRFVPSLIVATAVIATAAGLLPVLVVERLLRVLLGSPTWSLAGSLLMCSSVGAAAVAVAAALLAVEWRTATGTLSYRATEAHNEE
jgi:predicted anti-sigma-YlaC factor YlaD